MMTRKMNWLTIGLLAFLFLIMTFGGKLIEPSAVRTANTAEQFDTNRAFARIERILGDERPHPVGSAANTLVRERLIAEIKALGFTPDVTTGPACNVNRSSSFFPCTHVTNVAFRMGPAPKPGTKDTIMITTHYDSVPAGPGASDASIGTATLLEIAEVLKGTDLDRPLLFMFTDGEEGGLMGAHYFVRDDPRADDVHTMVNFEARGVRGPAFMFETSQPNGAVIPSYAKNVARPSANSVMSAVYALIPNSTDVAVYLPKGYQALNFAVVDGLPFYHTPHDNLANLSKRSLQHMGDQGLSSVRTLANEAASSETRQYLYADVLSRSMFVIPQILALPILALATILAIVSFWRAEPKTGRVRVLITPPLALLGAAFDIWILQWVMKAIRTPDYWWAHGWATQGLAIAVAILGALFIIRLVAPKASASQLTLAGWIWFLVPGFVCAFVLPGAMILFVLPAIAFLIAGLLAIPGKRFGSWIYAAAAMFTLLVFVPLFSSLGITLGYGAAWMMALVAGIVLLPFYGWLRPVFEDKPRWLDSPVWAATAVATALFFTALILPAATEAMPKPMNIVTVANIDSGEAYTGFTRTAEPKLNDAALLEGLEKRPYLPGYADIFSLPAPIPEGYTAPRLENISREAGPDGTTLISATIQSNNADRVGIMLPLSASPDEASFAGITSTLNGEGSSRPYVQMRCAGEACDGTRVTFTVAEDSSEPWMLYGEFFETAPSARQYIAARPSNRTSIQGGDLTLVIGKQVP